MTVRIERLRTGSIGENVYAVQEGDTGFLVDPGDDAPAILDFIAEKGFRISLVVLTHGHLDHTAAIPGLLEAWQGPKPGIAIHAEDAAYLGARGEETNRSIFASLGALSFFKSLWRGMPEPDMLLAEGDPLPGTGFVVLHTPGHSRGSVCLYHRDAGILFSGDTLFRDGIGRSDNPDSDPAALEASLARLALLPAGVEVHPGHGARTTIGRELGWQSRRG